jgi:predicted methyltransferase
MSDNRYWFYAETARKILAAMDRRETIIEVSTDLNLSLSTLTIHGDELILDSENLLNRADLQRIIKKESRVFYLENGQLEPLEDRTDGYYKLVPTEQAPLLEISGVKMHISKGINPFESAGQMAAQVVKTGGKILDTCSGLGYAASAALQLGARQVVSIEKSATVMALRKKNPWSQRIFGTDITLVHADVNEYIQTIANGTYDAIIHDPPRFSLAAELYGDKFYRELYRVMKKRGALFHYTGNPQLLTRGTGFLDKAIQRLKAAGFTRVGKIDRLMGITAQKS